MNYNDQNDQMYKKNLTRDYGRGSAEGHYRAPDKTIDTYLAEIKCLEQEIENAKKKIQKLKK